MQQKQFFKCLCGIMVAAIFTACAGTSIEGKWIESIPGMEKQMQGINLEKGGKASSINMATLQYETWEKKGNKLILSGKSIGNKQTISFSDTLIIENITNNEMCLKKKNLTINYQKQK